MCKITPNEPAAVLETSILKRITRELESCLSEVKKDPTFPAEWLDAAIECRNGLVSLSEQSMGRSLLRYKTHNQMDVWLRKINTSVSRTNSDQLHRVDTSLTKLADILRYEA